MSSVTNSLFGGAPQLAVSTLDAASPTKGATGSGVDFTQLLAGVLGPKRVDAPHGILSTSELTKEVAAEEEQSGLEQFTVLFADAVDLPLLPTATSHAASSTGTASSGAPASGDAPAIATTDQLAAMAGRPAAATGGPAAAPSAPRAGRVDAASVESRGEVVTGTEGAKLAKSEANAVTGLNSQRVERGTERQDREFHGRLARVVERPGTTSPLSFAATNGSEETETSWVVASDASGIGSGLAPGSAALSDAALHLQGGQLGPAAAEPAAVRQEGSTVEPLDTRATSGVVSRGGAAAPLENRAAVTPPGGAVPVDGAGSTAKAPGAVTDPRRVERGTERLDPEFRSRLARVVERMRTEHGHEVRVVETLRPQARQDYLYEQGRSRSGPVVTWTRSSNHTLGRAADVMIDGTYNNPKGYARLAEVAVEEGLRTLGPKDPGHVELPRGARPLPSLAGPLEPVAPEAIRAVSPAPSGSSAAEAPKPARSEAQAVPTAEPAQRGVARVAEVAQVAQVARVAQVAQVAQVASPLRTVDGGGFRSGSDTRGQSGSDLGQGTRSGIAPELLGAGNVFQPEQLHAQVLESIGTVGGADAVSRLARIMEIRDGVTTGPVDHVLLRLDNGSGGEDVIRVDLRGGTVGASIDLANAQEVDQMASRLPDLQRTLERQGLETEQLRVRSTAAGIAEAAEAARAVPVSDVDLARGASGGRTGSDSPPTRDRWENATHGQQRRDTDDPRQQSRRNPKGENKS